MNRRKFLIALPLIPPAVKLVAMIEPEPACSYQEFTEAWDLADLRRAKMEEHRQMIERAWWLMGR